MRLSLRFIVPLLLAIAAFAYAAVPLADAMMQRWFIRDLDARSSLIAAAAQDPLTRLIAAGSDPHIVQYFNRMLQDERLYALGLCFGAHTVPVATAQFPKTLDCAEIQKEDSGYRVLRSGKGLYHVAIRRVDGEEDAQGWLALVHDMSFVARRNEETRQYLFYFFIALGASIALITVIIAQISWRGWVRGLRSLLHGEGLLRPSAVATAPELRPIARDLRDLIRDLERQYRPLDGSQRIWDQQALRATLRSELHGNHVIAVSNREPYIHVRDANGIHLQHPASGLVTALEPVMRACSGVWIAHGSGSADRETVDRRDRVAVPPEHPLYELRRIWLTKEEEDGYYAGFANEGLWPLCHIAHVGPTFRASDFEYYRKVNERFADAVADESKTPDPVVLVQDYHFALVPQMIRERLPAASIITFWHIT
ncbi:MAG TPA: trehalose-6-phosphate synthase, partial [Casimicrobiaceae bacterium]|nr:trehalose-6-phosphate synthase [Casimicrobiaceae bacterium]